MILLGYHRKPQQELWRAEKSALYNFPVSIFSAVMGTAGLSRALRLAEDLFQIGRYWSIISGILAWLVFSITAFIFIIKLTVYPYKVLAEFTDPVQGRFYGTIPISLLLLAAVTMPYSWLAGLCCWITGTGLIFLLSYITVYNLLTKLHRETDFEPAMILPAVGILNVAQTGGFIHAFWVDELNIFCLAVGAVLTIVFLNLIFSRLLHFPRLNDKMEPTLMILMSPFGVCFLAYTAVSGHVDLFAAVLFYFGLFLFLILVFRILLHQNGFKYTWWSLAFPVAALTNAAFQYAAHNHRQLSAFIAGFLLAFLSTLIIYLLFKSIHFLIKGRLLTIESF